MKIMTVHDLMAWAKEHDAMDEIINFCVDGREITEAEINLVHDEYNGVIMISIDT